MKLLKQLLLISIILFLLGINNISYSTLSKSHSIIIYQAYVNGFVRATQLDISKLKELKKDEKLLKQTIKLEVEKYINKVRLMNMEEEEKGE